MFALGVCLMATVSSVSPTTAAPARSENGAAVAVASTYDDAACDLSDSGECAPVEVSLDLELLIELPAQPPPLHLDCRDPRAGEPARFGSCDLPRPVSPRMRLAWLRS